MLNSRTSLLVRHCQCTECSLEALLPVTPRSIMSAKAPPTAPSRNTSPYQPKWETEFPFADPATCVKDKHGEYHITCRDCKVPMTAHNGTLKGHAISGRHGNLHACARLFRDKCDLGSDGLMEEVIRVWDAACPNGRYSGQAVVIEKK